MFKMTAQACALVFMTTILSTRAQTTNGGGSTGGTQTLSTQTQTQGPLSTSAPGIVVQVAQMPLGQVCVQGGTCTMTPPPGYEFIICEKPVDYASPGTELYNSMVTLPSNTTIVAAPSTLMTVGAEKALRALEQYIKQAFPTLQLKVVTAWTKKPFFGGAPNLFNVGRSLKLELVSKADQSTQVSLAGALGTYARNAKFAYVHVVNDGSGQVIVSVRPDSCQANIDLLFLIDSSGSISSYWQQELSFVAQVIEYFDIGWDKTRVAAISYDSNNQLAFDFKQYDTTAGAAAKIRSLVHQGGGTETAGALNLARTLFTGTSYGAHPSGSGVPRVCVLVTDGQSNNQAQTIASAQLLRDANVNVFSIGAGSVNKVELNAVATDPDSSHVFFINSAADLETLVDKIAGAGCDEPAIVNPGVQISEEVSAGSFKYYKPSCDVLTDVVVVEQRDINGSAAIYVSGSDPNPGPYSYDFKIDATTRDKVLSVDRSTLGGNGSMYISVQGMSTNVATTFVLDVFNNIYNGASTSQTVSFDGDLANNTLVFSPPQTNATFLQDNTVEYRLTIPSDLFAINTTTGVVRTKQPIAANVEGYQLLIAAEALGQKCIRGGLGVKVLFNSVLELESCPAVTTAITAAGGVGAVTTNNYNKTACIWECYCSTGSKPESLSTCLTCATPAGTSTPELFSRQRCCTSCCEPNYYMKLVFNADFNNMYDNVFALSAFKNVVKHFIQAQSINAGANIYVQDILSVNLTGGSVAAEVRFDSNVADNSVSTLQTYLDTSLEEGKTLKASDGAELMSANTENGDGTNSSTYVYTPPAEGLGVAVIAGIVVGAVVLIIIIIVVVVVGMKRGGGDDKDTSSYNRGSSRTVTDTKVNPSYDDSEQSPPVVVNDFNTGDSLYEAVN